MESATDSAAAGRGTPSPPSWRLTDLIGVETLQSIQDTFAQAFGLPTVIVDTNGVNATTITHRVTFCEDLTRRSKLAGSRCADCDSCAMRDAARTSRPAIFKCWNGLYDCAIPIAPKGEVLGYFLCGQILTEEPDPARYAATATEIGVDPDEYVDAVNDVIVLPYAQYEGAVQSMHVLAQMIADQAAASIDSLLMLEDARRAKEGAAKLVEELDTILEALRDIGSQPDYQATLASIADNLARLIPWDSCVIYLTDDEREELVPVVIRDPAVDMIAAHRPRIGEGILGSAALGGPGRCILDVTKDPEFRPIPGIPLEPESSLVMPMVYKGTVSGVIMLSRFERRTFTDHELRVLDVFSSQASVSVQVAKLASDNAQRLLEERAFGRLRIAMAPRANVDSILWEAARTGVEVLPADAAVLSDAAGGHAATGRIGVDDHAAAVLLSDLADVIQGACAAGEHRVVSRGQGSALVLPFAAGEASPFGVFTRQGGADWDRRLVDSLRTQTSLGVEKARMQERERSLLLRYQRLSELGTELLTAHDAAEVRERLLARTPEMLGAESCFIAGLDGGPDAIAVEYRERAHGESRTLRLHGDARLATLRLRDEAAPDRSVFDRWSEGVLAEIDPAAGVRTWLAEPLPASAGALGGLFVGWRSPGHKPSPEESRVLKVLAGAAGTALGNFAASQATDSKLRDRLLELEALTGLAQRIGGLTRESQVADELLAALRRTGQISGAAYAVASESGLRIERTEGLDSLEVRRVGELLANLSPPLESTRLGYGADGSELVLIPIPGASGRDAFLAGIDRRGADDQRDRLMSALARYGSMALENAHLHDRQREAITRLERAQLETTDQYSRLEQVLSVHETLAQAVLEGHGLTTVVRSLGRFMDARLLVLGPEGRELACWPADAEIDWRPEPGTGKPQGTRVARAGEAHVIASPAVVDGETLAWIIAVRDDPPGELESAAVEYGALLVALELLRERTAIEVETRLRGGVLEQLFSETVIDSQVARRALALGHDLGRRSRVFLVEAAPNGHGDPPASPETFYGPVADRARDWSPQCLVAMRGGSVVVVAPEDEGVEDAPATFEDELREALGARLPDTVLNVAVGSLCEQIGDYRDSYLAARRGLDLLRLLERPGETFSFRMSTLDSMLLQANRPELVVRFIARYVEPLDRYDEQHTSELRRTLETYYQAGSTLEEAARRLHVHVSTLRYRLKKASQLLDIDLRRESPAALDLQIALRAARVLGV